MAKRPRPQVGRREPKPVRKVNGHRSPSRAVDGHTPRVAAAAPVPSSLFVSRPPAPAAEAMALFERAMTALQRHEYSGAAEGFKRLLANFPSERTLLDRARVYLELCDRELRRRPAAPKTVEERLTAATAALNDADEDRAERLAKSVLADAPAEDLALYLLAAVQARRGARDSAFDYLRRAAALSPDVRAQARHDPDFNGLHDMDAFRQLVENVSPTNQRRSRRPRAER